MDHAVSDLTKIAGQRPVVTKSKKAIAGFKIREDVPIGCMVTLRGVRMYEFLDRFVTIALPRVRDFRGISVARVRRPRQLQHRRQGTDHLSRAGVRQDRPAARVEHLDHHDREDRRRVPCTPPRPSSSRSRPEHEGPPWPNSPSSSANSSARAPGRQVREEAYAELKAAANDAEEGDRRSDTPHGWSCRSCRATPTPRASATAVRSRVARAARSASSASGATRSASWRSRATFPAWSRPVGDMRFARSPSFAAPRGGAGLPCGGPAAGPMTPGGASLHSLSLEGAAGRLGAGPAPGREGVH